LNKIILGKKNFIIRAKRANKNFWGIFSTSILKRKNQKKRLLEEVEKIRISQKSKNVGKKLTN